MKKEKSKMTIPFIVNKNQEIILNKNYTDEFEVFKKTHIGKEGQMTVEIDEGPRNKQHRRYRGHILPAIAEICGESDLDYFHERILKPRFKTFKVEKIEDVPSRYTRCHRPGTWYFKEKIVDGVIEKSIEYIPSTAAFTVDEMDEYIQNCLQLLRGLESSGSLEEIQERMAK